MNKKIVAAFSISLITFLFLSACEIISNVISTTAPSSTALTTTNGANTTTTAPSNTAPYTTSEINIATNTPTLAANNSGSSIKNIDDLYDKKNQDEGVTWKAYRSILSGDFTLIEDSDSKSEMEYLYKMDTQNGKCGWKFILMDFNKDSVDELFIQLDSEHNSAFLVM